MLLTRQAATLLPQTVSGKPVVTAHSQNREPRGRATFFAKDIAAGLSQLGLPATSPLSVLCVEILPGPIQFERRLDAAAVVQEDPLGAQLGQRRILRTSPLTAVPAIC